jgi:hypothetical protein
VTARPALPRRRGAPSRADRPAWLAPLAALAVLAAAAGCATTKAPGAGRPAAPLAADTPLTATTALRGGAAAQDAYRAAWERRVHGDEARDAGNLEQARGEWTAAADGLVAADAAGADPLRPALRYQAARLYGLAQAYDRAAEVAESVARDPAADERSKAMGWHLAAHALVNVASAEARAGKLPPIKLLYADQRTQPLQPSPPPGAWKRFVSAVDAYLPVIDADPEAHSSAEERLLLSPARLAVGAAKVSFAFDDLPDARARLEAVLARWPGEVDALAEAAPLYLQTFLVQNDRPGYRTALARLRALVDAQAEKADPKGKEAFARIRDDLTRGESGVAFAAAQRLLEAGKPADAAQAFEAIASDPGGVDAAGALHNAAIAWDRAEQPAKGAAARDRLLKERPDAKVAPADALALAAYQSRKGDHAAAARLYSEFLERWPDHRDRCIALQNVASELDSGKRGADAAERYLAFARDPACSRLDAGVAQSALARARVLFEGAGKPARAKEAQAAAEALRGKGDTRRPASPAAKETAP